MTPSVFDRRGGSIVNLEWAPDFVPPRCRASCALLRIPTPVVGPLPHAERTQFSLRTGREITSRLQDTESSYSQGMRGCVGTFLTCRCECLGTLETCPHKLRNNREVIFRSILTSATPTKKERCALFLVASESSRGDNHPAAHQTRHAISFRSPKQERVLRWPQTYFSPSWR